MRTPKNRNAANDLENIGGTVIGRGAEIGPGARLDGAVIFDGVRIEAGSWSNDIGR